MKIIGTSWRNRLNRVLFFTLAIAIVGVVIASVYVITTPKFEDRHTGFYILGPGKKAADFPKELQVGEEGKVILGIVNQEYKTMRYHLEVKIRGDTLYEGSTIILGHGEEWEQEVSFSPDKVGKRQKVEFVLSKEEIPYRWLHLWIDVSE